MANVRETLMEERERYRPQFEIDPIMAMAVGMYMSDNEILELSPIMRTALKRFIPAKYVEQARRVISKRKNGKKQKA